MENPENITVFHPRVPFILGQIRFLQKKTLKKNEKFSLENKENTSVAQRLMIARVLYDKISLTLESKNWRPLAGDDLNYGRC
jgi:hypothetical protein